MWLPVPSWNSCGTNTAGRTDQQPCVCLWVCPDRGNVPSDWPGEKRLEKPHRTQACVLPACSKHSGLGRLSLWSKPCHSEPPVEIPEDSHFLPLSGPSEGTAFLPPPPLTPLRLGFPAGDLRTPAREHGIVPLESLLADLAPERGQWGRGQ